MKPTQYFCRCERCHKEGRALLFSEGPRPPSDWDQRAVEGFWQTGEADWAFLLCAECVTVVDIAMRNAWATATKPFPFPVSP